LFTICPAQLPEPLGTVAADPLAFSALIRLVRQYGLARPEPTTLVLHRLLAAILRTQPHPPQDLATRAVLLLRAAVPADDPLYNPQSWPTWRQLLPHVLAATNPHRTLTAVEEDVAWLLNRAASYLQIRGEATLARPLAERALDLRRSLLGDDHPTTLSSAANLAFVLWVLGQYERARVLGEDTLTRCRQVLGDDHYTTLVSAANLVSFLWVLGQYERARVLGEDTLTRCRQVLGTDHPTTLSSAAILAAILWALGQYERARELGEDTLPRMRRILGDDHLDTLILTHNFAAVLVSPGEHDQTRRRESESTVDVDKGPAIGRSLPVHDVSVIRQRMGTDDDR
jgi:hypothetical protein